jgi:hypothetical protein
MPIQIIGYLRFGKGKDNLYELYSPVAGGNDDHQEDCLLDLHETISARQLTFLRA